MKIGEQTDLILLNFSKAFGKVAHVKLISKLHFYEIRGKTLSWVKDFLDSRSQAVILKWSQIRQDSSIFRCPAGLILEPVLFLAYINDLPDQVKSSVRLFADDTAVYLAISSEGESITLQNDLLNLERWEQRWDLNFNPSKCQVIHITISRAKCPIQTSYTLHGTYRIYPLRQISQITFLGAPTLIQSPRKQTKH